MRGRVLVVSPPRDADAIVAVLAADRWSATRVDHARARSTAEGAVIVVHAFAEGARELVAWAREAERPVVLVSAPGPDVPRAGPGSSEADCLEHVRGYAADAYVWRDHEIVDAVRFVASEDRALRLVGRPRLVFLGIAGADPSRSWTRPPVGASFEIPTDRPLLIGRVTQPVDVKFQTCVARTHAKVTRAANGVEVVDLGSSNGTWHRGERRDRAFVLPGEEIGIAELLRMRLDGCA